MESVARHDGLYRRHRCFVVQGIGSSVDRSQTSANGEHSIRRDSTTIRDDRGGERGDRKKVCTDGNERFWYFLASRVANTLDVERLKRETTSKQFEQWKAYFAYEPFGQDWLQAATVAAASCNPHLKKAIKVEQFIPAKQKPVDIHDKIDQLDAFLRMQ